MKIFKLEPVKEKLNSCHWDASTYQGTAIVCAESENSARLFASQKLAIATKRQQGKEVCASPWSNPLGIVKCVELNKPEWLTTEKRLIEPKLI